MMKAVLCFFTLLLQSSNALSTYQSRRVTQSNLVLHAKPQNAGGNNDRDILSSRRGWITTMSAGLLGIATSCVNSKEAKAAELDEEIEVYFGCGCFWHVQHEFVEAERRILGRKDGELTSRAGYAGGNAGASKDGKVCYHNALQVADYGSLGHAEVVRLKIPRSTFAQFAEEYFKLFDKNGYRPDQFGDVGLEYRNLIGIPGGTQSTTLVNELIEVSKANGDKLDFAKGKGDDPDRRALVFLMDTASYPFFVAEQYHQFHDGFNWGENYPNSYNGIANSLAKAGTLGLSGCPNGLLGIGALGL